MAKLYDILAIYSDFLNLTILDTSRNSPYSLLINLTADTTNTMIQVIATNICIRVMRIFGVFKLVMIDFILIFA